VIGRFDGTTSTWTPNTRLNPGLGYGYNYFGAADEPLYWNRKAK
jgi:hypothetical protein